MKVDLLPHNQEAYEKIKSEIEEGKKKIAIAHATGTGKSYLIAKLFEDYSEKRKLVLVPSTYISDQIKELFEKYRITNADIILYPEWKMEILKKYLPEFSCEYKKDRLFNEFVYYAKLYKKRYGHLNIKNSDMIDGYKIGIKRTTLNRYKILSKAQIKELENLGIYLGNKFQKQFDDTMELASQAIKEGVIIRNTNSKYKDKNLYSWIMGVVKKKYKNSDLSLNEIHVIEKLVGKSLDDLYRGKKESMEVSVIDIVENKKIGIFETRNKAVKVIRDKYGFNITNNTIEKRLSGKLTKPYKGRFMFYYADKNKKVTE